MDEDLEFHAWPYRKQGGQQVTRGHAGVLVIHSETGIAVVVESERSQMGNKVLAVERVRELLENPPWHVASAPETLTGIVHLAGHLSTKCGLLNMSNLEIRFDKEGFERDPERCKNCCKVIGCELPS